MSEEEKEIRMWYANLARLQIASSILDSVHFSISDDDPLIDKKELMAVGSKITLWFTR